MMEAIIEMLGYFFGEIILGLIVLYPGAFVIWLFFRGKKKFKAIIETEKPKSMLVGFLLFVLIITLSITYG